MPTGFTIEPRPADATKPTGAAASGMLATDEAKRGEGTARHDPFGRISNERKRNMNPETATLEKPASSEAIFDMEPLNLTTGGKKPGFMGCKGFSKRQGYWAMVQGEP